MSDLIKILLAAEIDQTSLNKIKKDIDNISNSTKAKPIKVNVDVDGKANEQFKNINLELQKLGRFDLGTTPLVNGLEVVGYSVKEAKDGTTKFTQSLNDGKNKIVTYSGEINRTSDSYEILGKSTRQATRDNQTFIKELGIAIQRTVEW